MNSNSVNALDLETSTLKLVNDPAKRGGGISARENIFVHEQTPDQVLILPCLSQTSNLEKEDTIVIQHVVDLS